MPPIAQPRSTPEEYLVRGRRAPRGIYERVELAAGGGLPLRPAPEAR